MEENHRKKYIWHGEIILKHIGLRMCSLTLEPSDFFLLYLSLTGENAIDFFLSLHSLIICTLCARAQIWTGWSDLQLETHKPAPFEVSVFSLFGSKREKKRNILTKKETS